MRLGSLECAMNYVNDYTLNKAEHISDDRSL